MATFLGFSRDAEASALVLGKDLQRLHIRTEASHGRLNQYEGIYQEHATVWKSIRNTVEMAQKRSEEAIVATLKTQVSKI